MAITRFTARNPWSELDTLTNRLNQMFGDFPSPTQSGTWLPAVDVEETAEELVLTAELPGMTQQDIELEVENNILTLRGEKPEIRKEGEEKKYHLWERRFGAFQRSFTLPRTVNADSIEAEFVDGVLQVRLPKVAEAKSRRIAIKGGHGSP
ncbi:MAG: Hsp20/alpha crystallin family protein [Gemmatimonadales bacterium]|jgi:HSP20 family protein|nr:MAG: Hsp20/alpha crystallin family protein [Gemmatimonadales bacterium]